MVQRLNKGNAEMTTKILEASLTFNKVMVSLKEVWQRQNLLHSVN